jgi:hypothetical protein
MARRRGRPGSWLAADDYTGFTVFASKLNKDFWGSLAVRPLERNPQEIASPLSDPYPVSPYRGPNYETVSNIQTLVSAPSFVGNTTVRTNRNNAAIQGGVVK